MAKLRKREGVKQHSGLTGGMTHLILKWKDFKWKKGLRNEVQRFSCVRQTWVYHSSQIGKSKVNIANKMKNYVPSDKYLACLLLTVGVSKTNDILLLTMIIHKQLLNFSLCFLKKIKACTFSTGLLNHKHFYHLAQHQTCHPTIERLNE